jgi:hypothetical protein
MLESTFFRTQLAQAIDLLNISVTFHDNYFPFSDKQSSFNNPKKNWSFGYGKKHYKIAKFHCKGGREASDQYPDKKDPTEQLHPKTVTLFKPRFLVCWKQSKFRPQNPNP